MTEEQISKLPPELQRAGEPYWASLRDDSPFMGLPMYALLRDALTWGLQMQEERDAANKRVEFLNGYSERRFDDAKKFYDELSTAEATIATLTRELNEARKNLEVYGKHTSNCEIRFPARAFCSCGYRAALSHTPEGGGQ